MDILMACYFGQPNNDVFETFLKTFRKVNNTALLQVYTDLPTELQSGYIDYNVVFIDVPAEDIKGQRCYRKIRCVADTESNATEGDRIIVCDVDLYFLSNPFRAFNKLSFDIGVTRRVHSYQFPVNSGLFCFWATKKTHEIFGRDFDNYALNYPDRKDWFIDQDYINHLFTTEQAVDIGWEYNFCPNTDVFGINLASDMIRRAYESRSVKVLHLKSELKLLIYDGFLEDAVTNEPNGTWNWQKAGR